MNGTGHWVTGITSYLRVLAMSALLPTWAGVSYAEHQVEGITWMLSQEELGYKISKAGSTEHTVRGGILGDEMGLGKTVQSLALIVNSTAKKTLIVMPLAVKKQWEEAAMKCEVNLFTATPNGGRWLKQRSANSSKPTIHIAHYDKVANKSELCEGENYDRIIIDEAQTIRNAKTKKAKAVLEIKATYKWVLTATPIVNKMDDAVTYLKFIGAPIAASSGKWRDEYEEWVRNLYMARTRDMCEAPAGLTMPPDPIKEIRHLEFTNPEEEKVYMSIRSGLEDQWRRARASSGKSQMLQEFSILLRLRQISVNPQIYIKARQKEEGGWVGPEFHSVSRKFDEIASLLRDSHEAGVSNRWIIFCQFHEEMEMMASFLKAFPFVGSVLQYHGGMSMKDRDAAINESHVISGSGKQDVFLIQLQAGGTGLNLQHYDRVIFVSPWWTAALLDQALGRAVRIGQKNVVKVYWLRLKIEDEKAFNIDTFIMNKADSKRNLGQQFLGYSLGRISSESSDDSEESEPLEE